jgi:hypothetical protein
MIPTNNSCGQCLQDRKSRLVYLTRSRNQWLWQCDPCRYGAKARLAPVGPLESKLGAVKAVTADLQETFDLGGQTE